MAESSLLLSIGVFAISLILIVKGSDYFVEAAIQISKLAGLSEFLIGLTIVAVGTSLPELVISVSAVLNQRPEIVYGNVIGSNIANIGLILGIAAVIGVISIDKVLFDEDSIFLVGSALLLYLMLINGVTRLEGLGLLIFFILYMLYLKGASNKEGKAFQVKDFLDSFFKLKFVVSVETYKHINKERIKQIYLQILKADFLRALAVLGFSCVAMFYGSKFIIPATLNIAHGLRVPESVIALTAISIGTGLPELAVALNSVRKGHDSLLLGNLIGSNVTNILLIVGVSALLRPLALSHTALYLEMPFMLIMTGMFVMYMRFKERFTRVEGTVLLILYTYFVLFLLKFR